MQHSRSDRILFLTVLMLALSLLPWLGEFGAAANIFADASDLQARRGNAPASAPGGIQVTISDAGFDPRVIFLPFIAHGILFARWWGM